MRKSAGALLAAVFCLLGLADVGQVKADTYPSHPIDLVVPWSAGGSTDILGRMLADAMSKRLGGPIVVDNKPGATGTIGYGWVARAEGDGYTMLLGTNSTFAIAPHFYHDLPYNPDKDFAAVGLIGSNQQVLCVLPERVWASGSANSSVTTFGQYRNRPFNVVNFINGGQGATAARDGYSALSFPANLGNTPVKMMEALAPILVHRREIRRGSGGAGRHKGGDGLTFEFEITPEASSVATSFLMTRLKHPPPGLNGGQAGQRGRLVVNGAELDPIEQRILKPGDRVLMESAVGGGYGTD